MGASSSIPSRFPSTCPNPKREAEPKTPDLRRVKSLPAHLPSHTPPPAEIKTARPPITRPGPDAKPPVTFDTQEPFYVGSDRKIQALQYGASNYFYFEKRIQGDPEYMDILKSRHPNFESYTPEEKAETFRLFINHPRFRAEAAKARNLENSVPNGPTAERMMTPGEQTFLTNAFRDLREEFRSNPFHIHGETAIVGNRKGEVVEHNYSPIAESFAFTAKEDRYDLHTHPPLGEPFTSSASEQDHRVAAWIHTLHNNRPEDRPTAYVTNGKDVLHIQPDSTELVRLIPDPEVEKRLGTFPVAFQLPDPQHPPHPFANHEAPPGAKIWIPPEDRPVAER